MLNPVCKLTDNMGGDEDQSTGFEPEEESTNFYHLGFGIKVVLGHYVPVQHLFAHFTAFAGQFVLLL